MPRYEVNYLVVPPNSLWWADACLSPVDQRAAMGRFINKLSVSADAIVFMFDRKKQCSLSLLFIAQTIRQRRPSLPRCSSAGPPVAMPASQTGVP